MPSFEELSPAKQFFFSRLFPWVVVLAGVATMYIGFENMYRAWKSLGWPTVEGEIITSSIGTQYGGTGTSNRPTYHAEIDYEYAVDGMSYTEHRVAYGEYGTNDPAHTERIVERYPKGSAVVVYYRPGNSQESVLEPGLHGIPWFFLVAGLIVLTLGLLMGVFLPRLATRGHRTHGETP